jgi:hypothetical protein
MGRDHYSIPTEFGPDGWQMRCGCASIHTVIVTCAQYDDGNEWVHASVATTNGLPTYGDLVDLHRAVWGEGFAYQQFVPARLHVNIHRFALHLYGRLDGQPVLPVMDQGTI